MVELIENVCALDVGDRGAPDPLTAFPTTTAIPLSSFNNLEASLPDFSSLLVSTSLPRVLGDGGGRRAGSMEYVLA